MVENTSAVIAPAGKGSFGGDDEVELNEPCRNGLLDERLDGLVLLELGPAAIAFFVRLWERVRAGQRRKPRVIETEGQRRERARRLLELERSRRGILARQGWRAISQENVTADVDRRSLGRGRDRRASVQHGSGSQ